MFFQEYKTILSLKNSINIYRGCVHGCIYCDSRSKCYRLKHDFEDVEVKKDAPLILDKELNLKNELIMISTGSFSDPYNPYEKELCYTRKCLEVILKHHCGVNILTKSNLILRDMDLIEKINKDSKAVVQVTLTTADDELCKIIEPNVSNTSERVEILKTCKEKNIRTVVWFTPFLPYINDTKENIIKLLDICSENNVYGIVFKGIEVKLREGSKEYFYKKLDEFFPKTKIRYIARFRGDFDCASEDNDELSKFIVEECKKRNIEIDEGKILKFLEEYPKKYEQISLFDF